MKNIERVKMTFNFCPDKIFHLDKSMDKGASRILLREEAFWRGELKETLKNASEICLYAFYYGFTSQKNVGRGSNPVTPLPLDLALSTEQWLHQLWYLIELG